MTIDYYPGFDFPNITDDEINVTWVLQRDYMAAVVNGNLVYYIENLPYTHFDMLKSSVGIGALEEQSVIVKSLTISELD